MKHTIVVFSLLMSITVLYADWSIPDVPPPVPAENPNGGSQGVNCTIKRIPVQVPCGGGREICKKDPWGNEVCAYKENTCTEYREIEECN